MSCGRSQCAFRVAVYVHPHPRGCFLLRLAADLIALVSDAFLSEPLYLLAKTLIGVSCALLSNKKDVKDLEHRVMTSKDSRLTMRDLV